MQRHETQTNNEDWDTPSAVYPSIYPSIYGIGKRGFRLMALRYLKVRVSGLGFKVYLGLGIERLGCRL